jgi:inositol-phosphate phosphatase / L-galactose 1-phosphate phosphatase / histidinol-phosphatase
VARPPSAEQSLEFSHHLADHVRSLALSYFRTRFKISHKADESVVTVADRHIENELRHLIRERFPDHGIMGEEYGGTTRECSWILDPIDGTASFVLGNPLFGTLIGSLRSQQPFTGLIEMPAMRERWTGDGKHALFYDSFGSHPVSVSDCKTLDHARLYIQIPDSLRAGQANTLYRLQKHAAASHSSCDCYAYGLLASGHCDLIIEDGLEPCDYLPIVPVVLGAGGFMTDWDGIPLDLNSGNGIIASATQPLLHQAIHALKSFR